MFDRDATGTWRCPQHQAEHERNRNARPNTTSRGYGAAHQRMREQLLEAFVPGQPCARCGQPILAAADADLGHDDQDRSKYAGLEHKRCNRATSGRARRGSQSAVRPPAAAPAAADGGDSEWYFV
jgi:hypothetical protein